MAAINQPKIKNIPPKGVTNQIALAGTKSNEIAKIEPEKNKIPKRNI